MKEITLPEALKAFEEITEINKRINNNNREISKKMAEGRQCIEVHNEKSKEYFRKASELMATSKLMKLVRERRTA